MISSCGHDENGGFRNGRAGDQSKTEYRKRSYYYFGQNVILRHPDPKVREKIAQNGEDAADNNNIGYDMNQRLTLHKEAKKVGWVIKKIKTPCEADCSSSTSLAVIAAGYLLGIKKLQAVSPSNTTWTLTDDLRKAGFQVLTGKKYLTSDKYLLRGDIINNENRHVVINLTDGSEAKPVASIKVDGDWGRETTKGLQTVLGTEVDGEISNQPQKYRQYALAVSASWEWKQSGYEGGSAAIKALQKETGNKNVDGLQGKNSNKLLNTWLGLKESKYITENTVKALQAWINKMLKK